MKEFKPEAILIRISVERSAARLTESELRRYQFEKVRNAEMLIDDPDFVPEFSNDLTGDLLEMAWDTIKAGIEAARAKHYANTSGKRKPGGTDNPQGTHRLPIDHPRGTHRPPNTYIHTDIHTYSHSDSNTPQPEDRTTDEEPGAERHTDGMPNANQMTPNPQPETEKKKRPKFTPPTVEEVRAECQEKGYLVSPEQFIDHYTSNGWKVGKNPMKDWQAALRSWDRRQREGGGNNGLSRTRPEDRIPGQRDLYEF